MKQRLLTGLLTGIISLIPLMALSQKTFTQHVMSHKEGEGKVVIHTDAKTDSIINNTKPTHASRSAEAKVEHSEKSQRERDKTGGHNSSHPVNDGNKHDKAAEESATSLHHTFINRPRVRQTGYRIQIFTGGNSHQDKAKAYNIGAKCRKAFPELSAYPRFMSPRWICRVGDFRTREEAHKYIGKIRAKGISREAHIVRCEVLLPR